MIRIALLSVVFTLFMCLTTGQGRAAHGKHCDTRSLLEVISKPLDYAGKRYCGEVIIRKFPRVIRIFQSVKEKPTYDLALLVTVNSAKLLEPLGRKPGRYYIEALVDPQAECFRALSEEESPGNGETCNPFVRPIFFHLISARRT